MAGGAACDVARIVDRGGQRLLAQDVHLAAEQRLQHRMVGVVGGGDDHRVRTGVAQHRPGVGEAGRTRGALAQGGAQGGVQGGARPGKRRRHRIGQAHDLGARDQRQVAKMLLRHQTRADQPEPHAKPPLPKADMVAA